MTLLPDLPPLLDGVAAPPGVDPFVVAQEAARDGVDPGLFVVSLDPDTASVGVVLAPETALEKALLAVFALEQAATDAIGALGPPELPVMWAWPDILMANGARVGRLRAAAAAETPGEAPSWLVLGIDIGLVPPGGVDAATAEPGAETDRTWLALEGAGDLTAPVLTGAIGRHFVRWIHDWESDGPRALVEAWTARSVGVRAPVRCQTGGVPMQGTYRGLDETGGLVLSTDAGTVSQPLSLLLERSRLETVDTIVSPVAEENGAA